MKILEDEIVNDEDNDFFVDDSLDQGLLDNDNIDDNYAEVEMVVAEPTKITDIDGSVIIVSPGDIVNIKSESLKRVKSFIKEDEEKADDKEDDKEDDKKKDDVDTKEKE
jgi:hypothetical protein